MKKILLSLLTAISLGLQAALPSRMASTFCHPRTLSNKLKPIQQPLFSMYAHPKNTKKNIWLEPSSSTFSIARPSMLESNNSTIPTPIMYTAEAASAAIMPV